MNKDELKQFYFSASANFSAFKGAKPRRERGLGDEPSQPLAQQHADAANVSASQVNISMPSTIRDDSVRSPAAAGAAAAAPSTSSPASADAPKAGGGFHAARNMATIKANKSAAASSATATGNIKVAPDAASAEYFRFLKQQQELQREHATLEATIAALEDSRRQRQSEVLKVRRQASELLTEIEGATDWKLKSKYGQPQLARDCGLGLEVVELNDDVPPKIDGIVQIGHELERIKQRFADRVQLEPHRLFVDQSLRRLSLLEKALAEGNSDSSNVAKIPDTLLVQLESVCALPTIDSLIVGHEEKIDHGSFKVDDARAKRAAAVSEGEVHIAEKLCYEIIDLHEAILEQVIDKVHVLDKSIAENRVLANVGEQYAAKTPAEFERIRSRATKLRARCKQDLEKMFALRQKVEEVEAQTAKKVLEERERSEKVLAENGKKLEAVFTKMEELEREVEVLERERHREVQRRLQEKDKDEHRRAEFARFCEVVEEHAKPLERTIRNADIVVHSTEIVEEMVNAGFASLKRDLAERERLLADVKLETHKQHVEVFRGLLLELGEIIYKKERMVEETDKKVQQAHIQQELLAETFNPNAKKFGDVKKKLLQARDDLEHDIAELKERAGAAMDHFSTTTESALNAAGVSFVHPVAEQEHQILALKAKMIEFKAMVVGHTAGQPIMAEIEALKEDINATRSEIEVANADTTGTMSKALPMIEAATKARRR